MISQATLTEAIEHIKRGLALLEGREDAEPKANCVAIWMDEWKDKFTSKWIPNGPDAKALKTILQGLGGHELRFRLLIRAYFSDQDPFIRGWPPRKLPERMNGYLLHIPENPKPEPRQESGQESEDETVSFDFEALTKE